MGSALRAQLLRLPTWTVVSRCPGGHLQRDPLQAEIHLGCGYREMLRPHRPPRLAGQDRLLPTVATTHPRVAEGWRDGRQATLSHAGRYAPGRGPLAPAGEHRLARARRASGHSLSENQEGGWQI